MTELIFVHRTVTKGWIRQEISLDHYKHKPQPEKQNKNRTKLGLCPPIYDRPDVINYADLQCHHDARILKFKMIRINCQK